MENEASNLLGEAEDRLSRVQTALNALYLLTSESNIREFGMVAALIEPVLNDSNEISGLLAAAVRK
ncbi:MAG: hypothetical protein ACYCVW_16185 [Rhodocyclaceae bacterium]